jgi:uncharacterized protein with gpF-like domain
MLPEDMVGGQEWIATQDDRVRDEHSEADGQVRSIAEPFDVGGAQMFYPGDPSGDPSLTVNCRCTIAFLTPEEFVAAKEEGRTKRVEVRMDFAKALLATSFDERGWRALIRSAA